MTSTFLILMTGLTGLLLPLVLYMLLRLGRTRGCTELGMVGEFDRSHVTYLPVIRQAMSMQDLVFLEARTDAPLVRRTHKERRKITALYVVQLRADFCGLLRLARVIAAMSPETAASHEFERLRLTTVFMVRYGLVVTALHVGWLLMPQLGSLIHMVSELAVRMEASMRELGERAMVATEVTSTLNRRSLDIA